MTKKLEDLLNLPDSQEIVKEDQDKSDKIAKSGIRCIIQPGGSKRDQEVIDACNEYSIAMAFTGGRCFNH